MGGRKEIYELFGSALSEKYFLGYLIPLNRAVLWPFYPPKKEILVHNFMGKKFGALGQNLQCGWTNVPKISY